MGKFLLSILCALVLSFSLGLIASKIYFYKNPCLPYPKSELGCLDQAIVSGELIFITTLIFFLIFSPTIYFIAFRNPDKIKLKRVILLISLIDCGILTLLFLWRLLTQYAGNFSSLGEALIIITIFFIPLIIFLILYTSYRKELENSP